MAKWCLLSDQSLVGQSRTPGADSTQASRDEDVHRLVSDVEQLIGIHADALFREPNPAGPCGCCRARRPVRGSVHRIALVCPETHWLPRFTIDQGSQSLGHSIELRRRTSPRVAGRTRSWWGAAGCGEGYPWNCRTSVTGRRGWGKLLFACGWCGAHPYQELRQTALSGE